MLGIVGKMLRGAGYLALWAGLYQGAVFALVATLCGVRIGGWALACVASLAMSVYLVDRAKLHPLLTDPADVATHPGRVAFLATWRAVAVELMIVSGAAALLTAYVLHPLAMALVPCAYAGVLWYAHPRRGGHRRPKQVLVVKNAVVAVSVAALSVALVVAQEGGAGVWPVVLLAGACAVVHVFADAALCDVDDAEGDARFAIRTIPVVRGARATLVAVVIGKVLAGVAVLLVGGGGTLAALPVVAAVGAFALPPGWRRDGAEFGFVIAVVVGVWV